MRSSSRLIDQGARLWRSVTQRVMSVTALGMLMSLAVDVLTAARLGATSTTDALIIALSLPLLLDVIMREGTKFSLLPLFVQKNEILSESEYHSFLSGVLNLFLVIGFCLAATGWLLAPAIIRVLGPGLEPSARSQAALLFRLSAPLILFAPASNILFVLLNSQRHFVLTSTRNAIAPTVVVLAMGLAWRSSQIPLWIAGGYTTGYGLFFFLLLWHSVTRIGFWPDWRAWPDRNILRQLWWVTVYPISGFALRQGSRLVERMLASLVAPGGVAAYYFAFRLVSAAQSIVGVSIATIGLPTITEHDLAGRKSDFSEALRRQVLYTIFLSGLVTVGIFILHGQVVRLLYGRGAFDPASVEQTATVLLFLGAGLVFICLTPVLTSGLYAQRRYAWVLLNMAFATTAQVLLAWWLSRPWGLIGIALSFSLSAMISVASLLYLLHRGEGSVFKGEGKDSTWRLT